MGCPSKNGAIVTMVRLQVTMGITGRCVSSRPKWDADLTVLVLPFLKEVARVAEMSKDVEKEDELVHELYNTTLFQLEQRFSPARHPEDRSCWYPCKQRQLRYFVTNAYKC